MKCPMPKCVNGKITRLLEGCILATYADKFDPCPNCGPDGYATRLAVESARAMLAAGMMDRDETATKTVAVARKRLEERE